MRRRTFILVAPTLAAGALAHPVAAQAQLKVVASFSILGDMVRQIGGYSIGGYSAASDRT